MITMKINIKFTLSFSKVSAVFLYNLIWIKDQFPSDIIIPALYSHRVRVQLANRQQRDVSSNTDKGVGHLLVGDSDLTSSPSSLSDPG